jgi:hypothetical protein
LIVSLKLFLQDRSAKQGQQLIEIDEIELENFTEATIVSKQNSCLLQRSLDNLKKAHPIVAPAVIRGF